MINWTKFEDELADFFASNKSSGYAETAKTIADTYHNAVMQGTDMFNNKPQLVNKAALEKSLSNGFKLSSLLTKIPANRIMEAATATGIFRYWHGANLTTTGFIMAGGASGVSNNVNIPALPIIVWPKASMNARTLPKALHNSFKNHINKLTGIFIVLNSNGAPRPISWIGIR